MNIWFDAFVCTHTSRDPRFALSKLYINTFINVKLHTDTHHALHLVNTGVMRNIINRYIALCKNNLPAENWSTPPPLLPPHLFGNATVRKPAWINHEQKAITPLSKKIINRFSRIFIDTWKNVRVYRPKYLFLFFFQIHRKQIESCL